jgi:hypothetical protein
MVMYLGRIAEIGPVRAVFGDAAASLFDGAALLDAVDRPGQPHRARARSPAIRPTRSTRRPAAASTADVASGAARMHVRAAVWPGVGCLRQ